MQRCKMFFQTSTGSCKQKLFYNGVYSCDAWCSAQKNATLRKSKQVYLLHPWESNLMKFFTFIWQTVGGAEQSRRRGGPV